MQASTCVVDYLNFAEEGSNRRDTSSTSKELYLVLSVLCVTEDESELATGFQISPTKTFNRQANLVN